MARSRGQSASTVKILAIHLRLSRFDSNKLTDLLGVLNVMVVAVPQIAPYTYTFQAVSSMPPGVVPLAGCTGLTLLAAGPEINGYFNGIERRVVGTFVSPVLHFATVGLADSWEFSGVVMASQDGLPALVGELSGDQDTGVGKGYWLASDPKVTAAAPLQTHNQ
jgi:hypothetical protein